MPNLTKEQLIIVAGIAIILLIGAVYPVISSRIIITQSSPISTPIHSVINLKVESNNSIYIHVGGEVDKPGLYQLEKGDRIIDLIKLCGITPKTDMESINLAEALSDGQKLVLPSKSQTIQKNEVSGSGKKKSAKSTVNINTADEKALDCLPGIGASLAKRIIEYREENGRFGDIEQLMHVDGITKNKFEKLKKYITAI